MCGRELNCSFPKFSSSVLVNFPTNQLTNATARSEWVALQVQRAKQFYLDGINIDFEDAIPANETKTRDGLTALTCEAKEAFNTALPGSQVQAVIISNVSVMSYY